MIAIVRRGAELSRIGATVHGSRNSALQPSSVSATRCFQSPSQSGLKLFSLVMVASWVEPDRAMVKLYPVSPSALKSMKTLTRSPGMSASRGVRARNRGTPSGCLQRKPMTMPAGVDSNSASVS